jgi:hypothetical protein
MTRRRSRESSNRTDDLSLAGALRTSPNVPLPPRPTHTYRDPVVIPCAGQFIDEDAPEDVVAAITDWWASLAGRSDPTDAGVRPAGGAPGERRSRP